MTIKRKPKRRKPSGIAPTKVTGKAGGVDETATPSPMPKSSVELKNLVVQIAEEKGSLKEIAKDLLSKTGIVLSQPTISKILTEAWGKDAPKKRAEMAERRSKLRRWKRDFEIYRAGIEPVFHKDYLSSGDGMYLDRESGRLVPIPDMSDTERKYKAKDIIKFVVEKRFGYSPNKDNPDELGTYDPSILSIVRLQLENRLYGLAEDRYKRLERRTFEEEMDKKDTTGMTLDEIIKLEKQVKREVRKKLKGKREEFRHEAKETLNKLLEQLKTEGVDNRTAVLLGKNLLERRLDPAFASSSKKFRGRQRMLALEGINPETGKPYVFSRVTYNIPFLLWNHPKRIQIGTHNLAKKKPELIHGEEPVVKAKFNDVKGVNLRTRMPKNSREDILTREAGIIITKDAAKKFRYFNVVEEGTLVVESLDQLPKTWRVPKINKESPIKTYEDFKKWVSSALDIRRGDPITFGRFEGLEGSPGYKEAKHSGKLIYVGDPKLKTRVITVDPDRDPQGRNKIELKFYTQDYQIVREDDLRLGDKVLLRTGHKGVISEIVDDLGKDEAGRPYEAVINYSEVWREADPSDPEYELKEETYFKQGKKKSGMVLEHEAGDGQLFFFLIDKMAQDQSTSGLRMSTTMLGGLWEWFLDDLFKKNPNPSKAEMEQALQRFVERYFGDEGTFVPSLKALHYKAVKRGDKVYIEIDENEPTSDEHGIVVRLPHTYAGRKYEYAYIPDFISRTYWDGKTFRELYQVGHDKEVTSATDFYWSLIAKQIKNRLYIFPRNEDAVNLVVVPWYYKSPEDYDHVIMDAIDYINAGGNPFDPNPMITIRKEPITDKYSIQTHPVILDWSGKYSGILGIHPSVAVKATIDFDGDQIVAFTPPLEIARVELPEDEVEELKSLKKKKYNIDFKDLYEKAKKVKYAEDEIALGVYSAQYNQETAEIENTMIQTLGGLRKRALLLYGSEPQEPIRYGSKKDPREEPITPELINRVCDVEKILKMREPRWRVRELEQKKWDDLTPEEKELVKDYHIRKELNKRIQRLVDTKKLHRLKEIIQNEKSFMEEDRIINRDVDPINLVFSTKGRLIDMILWQQIKQHPRKADGSGILEIEESD